MIKYSFTRKTNYYRGTVYEWNIPTGTTCPFALECKVKVDRITGKMDAYKGAYRCYAASAERFPAVRESRWANYEYVLAGNVPELPKKCKAIRIHASGDFFNQAYFDMWIGIAERNPDVEMWAYTKSLKYWIARLGSIPKNLVLTASYGGRNDELIAQYGLKNVRVYEKSELVPYSRPIDTNDDLARLHGINFALLDNLKNRRDNVS